MSYNERNAFYKVVDKIKEQALAADFRTIMYGTINDADLNRQSIFPLLLVIPQPSQMKEVTTILNFTLVAMDLVDFNKEESTQLDRNDDLIDVHQYVLGRLQTVIKGIESDYDLDYTLNLDPFQERFENLLAGWSVDIGIEVANMQDC